MSDSSERWDLVGSAIQARADFLGLTQAELIRKSGVSYKSLVGYIAGKPIKRLDKRRDLAIALGWPPDAIARLLRGEGPTSDPSPISVPAAIEADPLLDDMSRRMLLAAYDSAIGRSRDHA